ncbi:nuclear transport factor 2 family protein [Mycolicibacterium moriokaense]|nr:nuclear transport factor 2 family protein [Mycolicibacterium moriokaense]
MGDDVSDVIAITQLVNRYGLAVDSRRWELFDEIFTADADADYGPSSRWTDRDRFKTEFAAFHDHFDSTQHTMSTHLVDVAGDTARSFCKGGWRLIRTVADGDPLWEATGWYDDTLIRQADAWRIARRVCRITWWTGNPAVHETLDGVKFELATTVLHREADAGRVGVLSARALDRAGTNEGA